MATDRGDTFSFSELALAGGIGKSAYQHLAGTGLLPGGRGIEDFKRLATIGAFMASGLPLMTAAGMSKTIIEMRFNQSDCERLSGVSTLLHCSSNSAFGDFPSVNDYWIHFGLHRQGIRTGQEKLRSDALIEIVDRHYVFIRSELLSTLNPVLMGQEEASLVGWLEEWGRGAEPRLIHIGLGNVKYRQIYTEAQAARVNAVGTMTVNISLAIRRALDRLADHRERPRTRFVAKNKGTA